MKLMLPALLMAAEQSVMATKFLISPFAANLMLREKTPIVKSDILQK